MSRAVARIELKALDSEQRILEGWASTPECDRQGDIVESKGATYKLPIPLLMDHDHRSAVGEVISATVTDAGIRFRAKVAKVAEPGPIKDLCDSAWSAAKAGLRRAVSIGFRGIDMAPMTGGGWRYKSWEWYELSLVSVPACAGATIDQIKSIDRDLRMKSTSRGRVVRINTPVSRNRTVSIRDTKAWQCMAGTPATPIADALMKTADAVQEDLKIYQLINDMGATEYERVYLEAAMAHATDAQLAAIRERLARLEQK